MKLKQTSNPISSKFVEVRNRLGLTRTKMAKLLNTSLYALVRWERGDLVPNQEIVDRLSDLLHQQTSTLPHLQEVNSVSAFASHGSRASLTELPLFPNNFPQMLDMPRSNLLTSLHDGSIWNNGTDKLAQMLLKYSKPANTLDEAIEGGVSAGKNTYTYDAHTYHTKVPPQGIAETINKYLPEGGLVLDIFAGSGMTGVAALVTNHDVVLNELSPAASFISYVFTKKVDVEKFTDAINVICHEVDELRRLLYTTKCRECGASTEILYTVWSYEVECIHCSEVFILWDYCRKYGRTVREHKLLRDFACPNCRRMIRKSSLPRHGNVPVMLGYKCCTKVQMEHPLNKGDMERIAIANELVSEYRPLAPTDTLPEGVNLGQPRRHGLTSIDRFYTPRNLVAAAALWREIRRLEDVDLSAAVAFTFTSLYQRITRLSEYRFWGGSGNTANFNVPYISNEANVFVTFLRKAKAIADHFSTTATHYTGNSIVRTGSATDLSFLPNNSVDFIFTDPPFGANINYSEMNLLWESWLGVYTNISEEAIVNRVQGKGVLEYQKLMTQSLREAYRVLRPGHWMVLVFMNSSEKIWQAMRYALLDAGFGIGRIDIFDKQHGTFKQFVSENAAGSDLMIHCQKLAGNNDMKMEWKSGTSRRNYEYESIIRFIEDSVEAIPIVPFLHVQREREVDYRTLYSMYVSAGLHAGRKVYGFEEFRLDAKRILEEESTVDTLPVFTGSQKRRAKVLLAGKVASMMGRKLEESDWSEIYCKAKNIPVKGWSNLNIDVEHEGLGVELKMLRVRVDRGKSIEKFCGKTLMHPSMTRSIRIDSIERPAQKVMEDVFEQYAALIEDRTERVRKESRNGKADMRFGWLLWENSLTEFLYFEERMRAPNSNKFFAEWHVTPARGSWKESKSLWVYEKGTGKKRYSITTSAGIRIQPYFDVPHWGDSELVHFRVQSEYIGADTVLLWVAGSTAKQLEKKLGTMRKEVISDTINELASEHEEVYDSIDRELTRGVAIAVSEEAFGKLMGSGNAVSDEHGVQLLLRALE